MFCLLCVFLVFTNVGGRGMPDPALKLWDGRVELFILRGRECSSRLYLLQLLMFPLLRLYNSWGYLHISLKYIALC
mgnify:CR=1 FL=1